ncbi:uncharacterised protein [Saccharolobus solfataricus]|uniref:Uncharacterized protein n=1 Tax=Saccharolobus solfataricus TaxID=2287 RepID=A0A157T1M8_SACSO|nr:uncharacterised protein [Saccharolobus solfataricus]
MIGILYQLLILLNIKPSYIFTWEVLIMMRYLENILRNLLIIIIYLVIFMISLKVL